MYLIPPTLFHPPKPKINERMGHLPKLIWSRDVTGKVDNVHSNLTLTCPYMSLFVVMEATGFLWVIGLLSSLCVFMGLYASESVLVGPSGSLCVVLGF